MDHREFMNHSAAAGTSSTSATGTPATAATATVTGAGDGTMPVPSAVPGPSTGTNQQRHSPAPAAKVVSRNVNGTLVLTSAPGNEAELQLYRVMQRASLLAYYDTLLEMGGDDVQQLCDAGEEEFLEIMALVGMASKPLHVRRLQKALQEWVSNPGMFQMPLMPNGPGGFPSSTRVVPVSPQHLANSVPGPGSSHNNNNSNNNNNINNNHSHCSPGGSRDPAGSPGPSQLGEYISQGPSTPGPTPSPGRGPSTSTSPGPPGSPLQLTPVLVDIQIARLADSADHLVRSLPQFEPKPHNTKKKMCKDLEYVMNMAEDDPRRMDEIRKYAAIYGRFDCKRKPEKPLTLHEVSVNEAAAQICRFVPALLTRRDELFPLARQVVRDSGYHYSKGHSNLSGCYRAHAHGASGGRGSNGEEASSYNTSKRMRLESANSLSPTSNDFLEMESQTRLRRQERTEQIADELRSLGERTEELVVAAQQVRDLNDYQALNTLQQQMEMLQSKQTQLLVEQNDLLKQQPRYYRRSSGRMSSCFDSERPDTDDTDSQFSFSNASSPCPEISDSRDSTRDGEANGVQDMKGVLSSKISKQLVHDTLLDEGLRVVKELVANQCKESSDGSTLGHNPYESYHENKVQIIASSGGNIIAVANPALSMSPALPGVDPSSAGVERRGALKQEPASPPSSPTPDDCDNND